MDGIKKKAEAFMFIDQFGLIDQSGFIDQSGESCKSCQSCLIFFVSMKG